MRWPLANKPRNGAFNFDGEIFIGFQILPILSIAPRRTQDNDINRAIHQLHFSTQLFRKLRKRATAWLCNWHTRDSLTPITAPISFRFNSSS